jgi:hypothetical protein
MGAGCSRRIVRHQNYGASFMAQFTEEIERCFTRGWIQIAGRFVCQYHGRIVGERTRQRDPLLLANAELTRLVVESIAEADAV